MYAKCINEYYIDNLNIFNVILFYCLYNKFHGRFSFFIQIHSRDGSRFSNIRLVDLIIEYQLGCGIIF